MCPMQFIPTTEGNASRSSYKSHENSRPPRTPSDSCSTAYLKLCWQIYLLADRALCKIRRDWVTCCSRWRDGVRKCDQWSSLDSCPYFLWCGHRCSHSMVLREVG